MRILFVIPYYLPAYSYGGPLISVRHIGEELVKRGHQVTVATTDARDNHTRTDKLKERIKDVEVIRFRNLNNGLAKRFNLYTPFGFKRWISRNIQEFDIVFIHDFFTYLTFLTGRYCQKRRVPYIIHPHGTLCPRRIQSRFRLIKRLLILFLRGTLKNSKYIFVLTGKERKDVESIDISAAPKIKIVPNCINPDEILNLEKIDIKKHFQVPLKTKIIFYIGRIHYIKGIDISLKVLREIKGKIDFRFVIIGSDEGEKGKLMRLSQKYGLDKNIIFAGLMVGKERFRFMKSCDLFLFTSRSEGLPMSIIEAGALGLPQIISENCNVPEVERYKAGYVFSLNDIKGMSQKCVEILTNKELSRQLSKNGVAMVKSCFSRESIVEKICVRAGIS